LFDYRGLNAIGNLVASFLVLLYQYFFFLYVEQTLCGYQAGACMAWLFDVIFSSMIKIYYMYCVLYLFTELSQSTLKINPSTKKNNSI